jgi:hypothetical protein
VAAWTPVHGLAALGADGMLEPPTELRETRALGLVVASAVDVLLTGLSRERKRRQ